MKLLIISHTPHYKKGGSILGWGSTIREIDQLARLFDQVVHLAPLHSGSPPNSALPYNRENIRFVPVKPAGGKKILDKFGIFVRVPGWFSAMKKEIQSADVLHIRCPAGISLVGLIADHLWGNQKPVWIKYAGNWNNYPRKPIPYKLQQSYIKKFVHHKVVTINGHISNQPDHILTFINPSFSLEEYQKAKYIGFSKELTLPIKLLFVGRVSRPKGVDCIIEIARLLNEMDLPFELTIVGDGEERLEFEDLTERYGLCGKVRFTGWQPRMMLPRFYSDAHVLLLPSTSEGWPKVLSEAMAYGVVPLASAVGSIEEVLADTQAGLTFPVGDNQSYVNAIIQYIQDANVWKQASLNGISAVEIFTYEHYLENVKCMFTKNLKVELNHG